MGRFLPQQTCADDILEENTTGPTVDFLDVERVLVQFVLEDQLLQIVEGLLVNSLSDNAACKCCAENETDLWPFEKLNIVSIHDIITL